MLLSLYSTCKVEASLLMYSVIQHYSYRTDSHKTSLCGHGLSTPVSSISCLSFMGPDHRLYELYLYISLYTVNGPDMVLTNTDTGHPVTSSHFVC